MKSSEDYGKRLSNVYAHHHLNGKQ